MPNAEELINRAMGLVPVLRDRAEMTDKLRRIPDETVEDLKEAELFKILQPVRYGGFGLDYDVLLRIGAEFGRVSGSAAWCYSQWSTHNWMVGGYPQRAQEEFWADSPDVICATSFDPTGAELTVVEGGYRLSGRWSFSSGCDSAKWEMLAAIVPEGYALLLVPKEDYIIEDTWFVSGLKGTGSKHIRVEDAFIPAYRTLVMHDFGKGHSAGRTVHDSVLYRFPVFGIFSYSIGAPMIGMALGAVEAFEEYMRQRVNPYTGQRTFDFATQQTKLAESSAEVNVARMVMDRDSREVMERAHNNIEPSLDERARYRLHQGYVSKLCAQATTRLFEIGGGHSLFDSSEFARFHRDVLAASHHAGIIWDTSAEQYGRVRMGLEPTHPFI